MTHVRRPALRWHGGKWKLAPFIIQNLPPHRIYVEAYGGAASVLLRKPRSYAEVYNDLDGQAVNLFNVLRSGRADELIRALELTPFARAEFEGATEISDDPVEEARRLVVRSFMGFGSDGFNRHVRTGFRAASSRSGTTPAHDWVNYPENLRAIVKRIQGVVIEQRAAADICRQHDGDDTLFYLDPPYMPETRSDKSRKSGGKYHAYAHEMTTVDHTDFLIWARSLVGAVVISGYPTEKYDQALDGWHRVTCDAFGDGAVRRTEVLWINPKAVARMERLI
jgi:DNA adenine methylase